MPGSIFHFHRVGFSPPLCFDIGLTRRPTHVRVFFRPPSWRPGYFTIVIPAKAGIHFAFDLRRRDTDSRPCVFPPALLAVGSLSLACARESNQREHTLAAAVASEA